MIHCMDSSPFYKPYIDSNERDVKQAITALKAGNLLDLGRVMEHSTLKMHAVCLSANPGFWYANPTTMEALEKIKQLRSEGHTCYFTMDAGPHVKVLCPKEDSKALQKQLEKIPGNLGVDICLPGQGAKGV